MDTRNRKGHTFIKYAIHWKQVFCYLARAANFHPHKTSRRYRHQHQYFNIVLYYLYPPVAVSVPLVIHSWVSH